jgi:hypothetical protein
MGILDRLKRTVRPSQTTAPEPSDDVASTAVGIQLVPMTAEAAFAIDNVAAVPLRDFPFRIGRERRTANASHWDTPRLLANNERRRHYWPSNDLYLREVPNSPTPHISDDHCAIEWTEDRLYLVDRGSTEGTGVQWLSPLEHHAANPHVLRPGERSEIRGDGSELIVIGSGDSPYVFRLEPIAASSHRSAH